MVKIGIFGAGAIGCYVGGKLSTVAGEPVTLLVRERLRKEFDSRGGLSVSEQDGTTTQCPNISLTVEAKGLASCDVIMVSVKSLDTEATAQTLSEIGLKSTAVVVSLQNGIKNTGILKSKLSNNVVLKGMVSFNVERVDKDDSQTPNYGKCTSGPIIVQAPAADDGDTVATQKDLVNMMNKCGIPTQSISASDMEGIQWCKLLFNLNNSINALSGQPLKTELLNPEYRLVLRDTMAEAMSVLQAGKKPIKSFGTMIPWVAKLALPLPNFLYQIIARGALNISPDAHSSMYNDMKNGRKTEIDFINGEVVALGQELGIPTPVNTTICAMIKELEGKPMGEQGISAKDIQERIAKTRVGSA